MRSFTCAWISQAGNFSQSLAPWGRSTFSTKTLASPRPFVSELAPQERLVRLAANIYHVRLLPQDVYARELLLLGGSQIKCRYESSTWDRALRSLNELCDCILADAETVLPRQPADPRDASTTSNWIGYIRRWPGSI